MGWWNQAKATIKSGAKKVAKATQTDVGKLVTGQAFVEGVSQMVQNPTAMLGSGMAANQEQSGDSSNTQTLANPTSSSGAASQQTEQGLKNMTGSSDSPGKYSSVNNGGVYYGL